MRTNTSLSRIVALLASLCLQLHSSSASAEQVTDSIAPESASQLLTQAASNKSGLASTHIVVAAHPLATRAGYETLERGGNAIDAMVAVQTVLGLVEPQSSGMGGGAFLLYYDAAQKKLRTFDGRETAPLAASEELFIDEDGQAMAFFDAVVGGRSVGTPGTPKLLWERHKADGLLPWKDVLSQAIELGKHGFVVTPRLASALEKDQARLSQDPDAAALYYPNGVALRSGATLKNMAYANTLLQLSEKGGNFFYHSDFSKQIIEKVNSHANAGTLSQRDFDNYELKERDPVCSDFRDYEVCGMGPPSSGAIAISQSLRLLEHSAFGGLEPESPLAWHFISEAMRLAFADRGQYVADTDFITLPDGLLSDSYLKQRSQLIDPKGKADKALPGQPDKGFARPQASGISPAKASTTHFVIVDKMGNIVSMTSTIENGFGSRLMVGGFLLNNELTDFSFRSSKDGYLVANRVQPGKRPRSSMAPTIVFKNQKAYLAIGSPGGSRIINYVGNTLIRTLAWNQKLQTAIDDPHIVNRFGPLDIEPVEQGAALQSSMEAFGYDTQLRALNSGLHGVMWTGDGMIGAADKRREGSVMGR